MNHQQHMQMDGQQHANMQDGHTVLWSDAKEWLGFTPGEGDDVTIPSDLTVILDENTAELGTLAVNGKLVFDEKDLTLTADNVVVNGEFWVGTEENPFEHDANIILTGKQADADVVVSDLMDGMPNHGGHHNHDFSKPIDNKALIVTGKLELHGAEVDSWTQLNSTVNPGDTSITLADNVKGWNVGDTIAIAPTDFDAFEAEERTITRIQGSTVFFDEPLEYRHYGKQQDLGNGKVLDMRAEVTNLSRNITITGSDEGENQILRNRSNPDYYTRAGYGGHTVYLPGSQVKIDGVEFARLGNSGELGNYPVHFHHTGNAEGSYFKNSSIHHTFQRGLVVHQTDNLLVEGNTIYDTMSHSYFLEDGVETGNRFVDNLAMLPRSTSEAFRIDNPNNNSRKFERASAFWITNPANAFEGNHAVGVPSGQGFWFVKPDDASGTAAKKRDPINDLPLQQFEGNTAHTIMFDTYSPGNLGYRFNWTGNALEFGSEIKNQPDNAAVKDFTAWKVGNMAIQIGPSRTLTFEDPILADARIMIQSDSRSHPAGSDPIKVIDPTLVADTDIVGESNIETVLPKNFKGPYIAESIRPIEFTGTTILGEDELRGNPKAKHQNQLTFKDGIQTPDVSVDNNEGQSPVPSTPVDEGDAEPDVDTPDASGGSGGQTPVPSTPVDEGDAEPDVDTPDDGGGQTPVPSTPVEDTNSDQATDDTIGEYGTLNLNQQWQTISLDDDYINPVIMVSDPTFNGGDSAAIRLRKVTKDTFQIRLQEPSYKDGKHTKESVSYLVMEAGDWTLADGTRISAGTYKSNLLTSKGFDTVNPNGFDPNSTVLSQVQTSNGADWVTTRTTGKSSTGFQVAMQKEEALNKGTHADETIGWFSIGSGVASDGDTLMEADTTARRYNHNRSTVGFKSSFNNAPSVIAKMDSFYGTDTANLRLDTITSTSFGVRVHEEQSKDSELKHTTESISFLALEGKSGVLTGLESGL